MNPQLDQSTTALHRSSREHGVLLGLVASSLISPDLHAQQATPPELTPAPIVTRETSPPLNLESFQLPPQPKEGTVQGPTPQGKAGAPHPTQPSTPSQSAQVEKPVENTRPPFIGPVLPPDFIPPQPVVVS
ncbi:MAG: hypothetical protein RL417_2538, partial [Pseudomonadota bacterium]